MTDREHNERLLQSDGQATEDPVSDELGSTEDPVVVETEEDPVVVETEEDPAVVETEEDPAAVETEEDPAVVETEEDSAAVETKEDPAVVEAEDPIELQTSEPFSEEMSEPFSEELAPASAPVAGGDFSSPVSESGWDANAPVAAEPQPVVFAPTADEVFSSPASAPTAAFPSPTTMDSPTSAFAQDMEEAEKFLLNPFHLIVIGIIVGVVTLLLFWKCCKSWKLRREKQMLRMQSTRVDAVLGDMQMVGMDDYNDGDDPELI
mmetsp:Transcript_2215/g.5922  ORF Transcript_2215/g.5922 Transcript_2215/m.5922 type:complete len:263 (+) Transcript_2215:217-1005(+)